MSNRPWDVPIDMNLVKEIGGDETVFAFQHLGITHVLDTKLFQKLRGYEPCVGSIFYAPGQFGSVIFDDDVFGMVQTLNGTYFVCDKLDFHELSQVYAGRVFGDATALTDQAVCMSISTK